MATRSSEEKRRLRASGVVRSLPSSIISPLCVSRRHRQEYLSPRSTPAVVFGCPLLPSISRADPPSIVGLLEPGNHCRPKGYCAGGRPSHLIFGERRKREVRDPSVWHRRLFCG